MSEQYLSNKELKSLVGYQESSNFKVISQDSYSDSEVWKTIKNKKAIEPLLYTAIQTSVVGFGNKVFGEYESKGEKIDVKKVYELYNVKSDLNLNSKIQPGDLTPRRIQRFFRKQISEYISNNEEVLPYLWKNYSTMDQKYRHITFPGAESLVNKKDEALYLLETYKEFDKRMKTDISSTIQRVLLARGILNPNDIKSLITEFNIIGENIFNNIMKNDLGDNNKVNDDLNKLLKENGVWNGIEEDKDFLNYIDEISK